MSVAVITGSAGLIGSEASRHFAGLGMTVIGIDNDLRAYFFGPEGSTLWNRDRLRRELGQSYIHSEIDIRDADAVAGILREHASGVEVIVHTAAQPSHDWAAREPHTDFAVNATGTLNLLEAAREHCPEAPFIHCSTNKVYGDRPNQLPLVEQDTRWEIEPGHRYAQGIAEDMPVDRCLHSLFGASKLAADILVQEYGRYFQIPTACFRGGCLTGPNHSGAQLHGFLAYLLKCAVLGAHYTVFGYKGKQVRDNIHSADLISAFDCFFRAPRIAEVYNIGGGRFSNCSMLEAITSCEEITGRPLDWNYSESNRVGDHIWWISDNRRFQDHFPDWELKYDVPRILAEIHADSAERWVHEAETVHPA